MSATGSRREEHYNNRCRYWRQCKYFYRKCCCDSSREIVNREKHGPKCLHGKYYIHEGKYRLIVTCYCGRIRGHYHQHRESNLPNIDVCRNREAERRNDDDSWCRIL